MLVCHCHRVSDREVARVVDAGATRVGQVVRATKAGTCCGTCLPQLREVVERYFHQRDEAERLTATG